ncbi:hypothetical protein BDV19DRAFT_386102 [Aspergillus venezuelensis]
MAHDTPLINPMPMRRPRRSSSNIPSLIPSRFPVLIADPAGPEDHFDDLSADMRVPVGAGAGGECVALITGAASGIGLACAHVFIEEGVTRLILSDIDHEALSEAAQSLYSINPSIQTCLVKCDVSSEEHVEEMIVQGVKRFGVAHYCVNNAGITSRVRIKTHLLQTEDWDDVVDVNLRGVWLCQRAELMRMVRQEKSLVMSSQPFGRHWREYTEFMPTGPAHHPSGEAYSATNASVLGITRTGAVAYAEDGIRVNSVLPGFVETPLTEQSVQRGANYEALIETIPIKRWGIPAEVAQAVVFLCSDRASMITGQQLAVSWGMEYSC